MGAAIERAGTFVNALILLRYLAPADYGTLVLIYSLYGVLALVAGLGQGELVVARRAQARGRVSQHDDRGLLAGYLLLVEGGVAAALLAAILAREIVPAAQSATASVYWLAVTGALGVPIRTVALTYLSVEQDFRRIKLVDIFRSVALAAGYLIGVGVLHRGVPAALAAYALSNAVVFLLVPKILPEAARAVVRPVLGPMLQLLRGEGKFQLLRNGMVTAHGSLRPWLIQLVLGPEAVALFQAAKTIVAIPSDLLPFKEYLLPVMSQEADQPDRLRRLYASTVRQGTWLFAGIALGLIAAAPWLFGVFFPKYGHAVPLIRWMALSLLFTGAASPQLALFYALQLQAPYFLTSTLSLAIMLVVSLPLMWGLGVGGMAIGFVINSAAVTLLRHLILRRRIANLSLLSRDWLRFGPEDRDFIREFLTGR
ncbi:MAG TPA: lipopolysaccharide biosynthesis protein [bacterium]|nr:lipopolysaccharide biosynthesis protein [bacterium]